MVVTAEKLSIRVVPSASRTAPPSTRARTCMTPK
jgi:hypothetical protein